MQRYLQRSAACGRGRFIIGALISLYLHGLLAHFPVCVDAAGAIIDRLELPLHLLLLPLKVFPSGQQRLEEDSFLSVLNSTPGAFLLFYDYGSWLH